MKPDPNPPILSFASGILYPVHDSESVRTGRITRKNPIKPNNGLCGTMPCKPAPNIEPATSQVPYLLNAENSMLSHMEMVFAPLCAAWTKATTAIAS